jgi:hypothetical protein
LGPFAANASLTSSFGEEHLRRVLHSYAGYYNGSRTHWSLHKDAPVPRPIQRIGALTSHPFSADFIINTSQLVFDTHSLSADREEKRGFCERRQLQPDWPPPLTYMRGARLRPDTTIADPCGLRRSDCKASVPRWARLWTPLISDTFNHGKAPPKTGRASKVQQLSGSNLSWPDL